MGKMFLATGIEKLEKEKFVCNVKGLTTFINKPYGTFWGSTYTPREKYNSAWQEWCYLNNFKISDFGILFKLKDNSKILVIDSIARYREIIKSYGIEQNCLKEFNKTILDFNKIAKEFDGIHLTEKGQSETYFELYGWDCESVCLFNIDCIESWKYIECKPNWGSYD